MKFSVTRFGKQDVTEPWRTLNLEIMLRPEATTRGVLWKKEACSFITKRLWHRYFPVNFAKFLRTPFFIEHFWWLLLNIRFSSEMYFTNLDNAWSFWLALQQILFRWFPNAKLLSVYIPSDFTQFLLSVMEPLAFTGTVW